MAKIADIVKQTGLSYPTVSQILGNRPGYNEQTRDLVLRTARELNYRPNYLSKALVGGKSMSIGMVVDPVMFTSPVQSERISVIERIASQNNYLTYIVGNPSLNEIGPIQNLLDRRVDGMIIYSTVAPSKEVLEFLNKQKIPIVYIDWAPEGYTRWVKIDRSRGLGQLARHLTQLGHRRIRYIPLAYDLDHPGGKLKLYREAFEACGISLAADREFSISPVGDTKNETQNLVRRLIEAGQLPTALLLSNDLAAQSAISALLREGIRVPDQVNVAGFDDMDFADLVSPSLTTVRQPVKETFRAFDLLYSLIQDPAKPTEAIDLPCELVVRQSTGPAVS